MHTEVRITLVLLALVAAALAGRLAWSRVTGNLTILRTWQPVNGIVHIVSSHDYIEVELGQNPESDHVIASADHMLGVSFLKPVTVYRNPAKPEQGRIGGVLQLWLFPTVLALAIVLLLGIALSAAAIGRNTSPEAAATGRWMFSTPPPATDDPIHLREPRTASWAPLIFAALGICAVLSGIYAPNYGPMKRTWLVAMGSTVAVALVCLSWHNKTMHLTAGQWRARQISAFGWREFEWTQVKSVERRRVIPTDYTAYRMMDPLPFPGTTTETIVFADARGRTLLRISPDLQPAEGLGQMLDFCTARTGLHEELRKIRVPKGF